MDACPVVPFWLIVLAAFGMVAIVVAFVAFFVEGILSPKWRAERSWNRQRDQRAAQYVALGIEPYEARRRAANDMHSEAEAALSVELTR